MKKKFKILIILLALILSGFYIFQINDEVSLRYSIDKCSEKINTYTEQNKSLQVSLSKATSLTSQSEVMKNLGYQNIGKVEYIKADDGRMAANYGANEKLAD